MGIKVNFSDKEAASEALSFDAIPSGTYYARVTDITEMECGPESKNPGKPYWNIEFTIQEGQFVDRKIWTNAMLFDGALYTLTQLLKATGYGDLVKPGVELEVPDAEDFFTKEVDINVKKMRDAFRETRDGDGEPQWKNEVKGIKAHGAVTAVAGKTAGKVSRLP